MHFFQTWNKIHYSQNYLAYHWEVSIKLDFPRILLELNLISYILVNFNKPEIVVEKVELFTTHKFKLLNFEIKPRISYAITKWDITIIYRKGKEGESMPISCIYLFLQERVERRKWNRNICWHLWEICWVFPTRCQKWSSKLPRRKLKVKRKVVKFSLYLQKEYDIIPLQKMFT